VKTYEQSLKGAFFCGFQHSLRHPREMGKVPKVNAFSVHLAVEQQVSASTQNQALAHSCFLYQGTVGNRDLEWRGVVRPASRPATPWC